MLCAKIIVIFGVILSSALLVYDACWADETGNVFAIYQITKDASELDRVELESEPFISERDIAAYDWRRHLITLKEGAARKMPANEEVGVRGKFFVVVAGGQRCYRGAWWTSLSSMSTELPVINIMEQRPGELHIDFGYPESKFHVGPDLRGDVRIYNALLGVHLLVE